MTVEVAEVAELLAAALGGGGAGALLTSAASKRKILSEADKSDADAAAALSAAAISLIQPLNDRISTLEGELRSAYKNHAIELKECHSQRAELEKRVARLENLMVDRGVTQAQLNQLRFDVDS